MKFKLTAAALALSVTLPAVAADLVEFTAGQAAVAADVNANFTAVAADAMAAQTAADAATASAATNSAAITANATVAADSAATNATAVAANTAALTSTQDALETSIGANSATVTANTGSIADNATAIADVAAMIPMKMKVVDANGDEVGVVNQVSQHGFLITLTDSGIVLETNLSSVNDGDLITPNYYYPANASTSEKGYLIGWESEDCTGQGYLQSSKLEYIQDNNAYTYNDVYSVYGDYTLWNVKGSHMVAVNTSKPSEVTVYSYTTNGICTPYPAGYPYESVEAKLIGEGFDTDTPLSVFSSTNMNTYGEIFAAFDESKLALPLSVSMQ